MIMIIIMATKKNVDDNDNNRKISTDGIRPPDLDKLDPKQ